LLGIISADLNCGCAPNSLPASPTLHWEATTNTVIAGPVALHKAIELSIVDRANITSSGIVAVLELKLLANPVVSHRRVNVPSPIE
jgi:hypothetical protein